mmetsp:Transcript_37106/g.73869  ORF Transcript_37106/g.73869 Transcript_37106/m.73869 type:complete len:279 (-) Transcript_37106:1398-2234(-)
MLFLKDCICLLMFAVEDEAFAFLAFGSCFSWIASRLWIARSISMIICSCRRLSWSSRSSMRWISFFMAAESACPTLGSSASCISFSKVILRSHSSTCLSASRICCVMSPFSSRTFSMERSVSKHFDSISLSFCTKSFSIIWLKFWSSVVLASFFTTAPFMRSMSNRRCFMELSKSLISFFCDSSWASMRSFFCSSTTFRFCWSFRLVFSRSVSADTDSNWVCFWIQSFCMSPHSFCMSAMAFFMCLILASWGPATSASLASASNFVLFSSYSRFKRST